MRSRSKVIEVKRAELDALHKTVELMEKIPDDGTPVVLTVLGSYLKSLNKKLRVHNKYMGAVVRVVGFNPQSLICEVLAKEHSTYEIRHLTDDPKYSRYGKPDKPEVKYRYKSIREWRFFEERKAPLFMCYEYLSEEFKQLVNWSD